MVYNKASPTRTGSSSCQGHRLLRWTRLTRGGNCTPVVTSVRRSSSSRSSGVQQISSHLILQYKYFLHFLRTIRFGYTEHSLLSLDVRLPRRVVDDLVLDDLGGVALENLNLHWLVSNNQVAHRMLLVVSLSLLLLLLLLLSLLLRRLLGLLLRLLLKLMLLLSLLLRLLLSLLLRLLLRLLLSQRVLICLLNNN